MLYDSKEHLNKNHGASLKRSEGIVGKIYPVIRDGNGKIIDGFHRIEVDPHWESITLKEVKTIEDRLIVGLHANLGRRSVRREEKRKTINALAKIYWDQGLRPKVSRIIIDKTGRKKNINENQINQKLNEVLKGVIGPTTISRLLLPRFKDNVKAEVQKRVSRERQDNTPALMLIQDCFGKQIEGVFGVGIFGRLEREMISTAKEMLRNDPWWISEVKNELRDEIIAEMNETSDMRDLGCLGDGRA